MKIIEKIKAVMQKDKKSKIYVVVICGILLIAILVTVIVLCYRNANNETVVYKETTVEHGDLTVGITEDSTVSIGTVEQTFDLDISALVSDSSSSSSTNQQGGMMGMMNFGNSAAYSSKQQEMEVESVNVAVGAKVSAGDVLYTLDAESVEEIRSQLEQDVEDTKASYDALLVEQKETQVQAKQGYDTYVLNGDLADVELNVSLAELQEKVKEAEDTLQDKTDAINENLEKIVDYQNRLEKAKKSLAEAQAGVDDLYEDREEEVYYYITYENAREDASDLVDELEDNIEELEEENETLLSEMQTAARNVSQAQREYELGALEANETKDTDVYYKSVASEWYDIQLTSLNADVEDAAYEYESAVDKLEEFNTYIVGNDVVSEYEGVITEVPLEAGDTITMNTTLIVLYDQDEVTMEVTLVEEDKSAVEDNGGIVVNFEAYPDSVFEAVISDIGDATYDSDSGDIYYTITVTLQGDVSGLYEGMTGDITFITKESQEVTYVSNRAILRDGTRSYVKVKNEKGDIVEQDVTTGFSDGSSVEIVEGLSEGDIVLIESKVSE